MPQINYANKHADYPKKGEGQSTTFRSVNAATQLRPKLSRKRLTPSVAAQTVIHEINLLNRVLKAATLDWGIALPGGLPTAQVRKPTKPRGRDQRITRDEIQKILDATESVELRAVVTLAVETGMRRGELASLRWEDVDLKNTDRAFTNHKD